VVLGILLPVAGILVLLGMEKVKETSRRSAPELKQVALALRTYNEENGRLPPAAVYDKKGRPLYSWRVLILPYLGHKALYGQFHVDEPWDSEHNLTLLDEMPAVYAPPRGKRLRVPPHHTVVHVLVGKGAAFEGKKGLAIPKDFPDGTSNTLLVVEAGKPVPWTKPEDIPFDPDGPLPRLNGLFDDGFRAALADGSVVFVSRKTDEWVLRRAIRRDDGVGMDW
jgi:hypothetical protein